MTSSDINEAYQSLCAQISELSAGSVFAVGGTIPITQFGQHRICGSDCSDDDEATLPRDLRAAEQEAARQSATKKKGVYPSAPKTGIYTKAFEDVGADHEMRCDPITIRWDDPSRDGQQSKITLPIQDSGSEVASLGKLVRDCQPAKFGRKGEDVFDEDYRKAGKLDEESFSTNFSPYVLGIVNTAAQALAGSVWKPDNKTNGVRAELYKLNVYSGPSGRFRPHVDTPRSRHQIGSLVICLPSVHEGGGLAVRHTGRELLFDWSGQKGANAVQWAAFYSDCEHEVLEVTSGHRITLTYNLYHTCSANRAVVDPSTFPLAKTLTAAVRHPDWSKKGMLIGYHTTHSYPHTTRDSIRSLPATLKGSDKVIFECLRATGLPVDLRASLDFDEEDMNGRWYIPEEDRWGYKKTKVFNKDQVEGDLKVVSKEGALPERAITAAGFYEDSMGLRNILPEWDPEYTVQRVKWLNGEGPVEDALAHGTYGNDAGFGILYSSLVMLLRVPPTEPKETGGEGEQQEEKEEEDSYNLSE